MKALHAGMVIVVSAIVIVIVATVVLTVFNVGVTPISTLADARSYCSIQGASACQVTGSPPLTWNSPSVLVDGVMRSCSYVTKYSSCPKILAGSKEAGPQIFDNADVMGNTGFIETEINDIYKKYGVIIVIETLESLEGKEPDSFARERFSELGLDRDGVPALDTYILYVKDGEVIRIVNDVDSVLDKNRIDDIRKTLADEISRGNLDEGLLNAVKSLEDEIAKRIEEGLLAQITENQKNMDLYTDKTVFLVSDEDWRDALSMVPAAVWSRNSEECQDIYAPEQGIERHICGYPLLIYHREGDSVDADSIALFLEQYGAERVLLFGDPPEGLANLIDGSVGEIKIVTPEDYGKFWLSSVQAVAVENDYKTAMMASVYASYLNAPLLIQGRDLGLDAAGKEFICIGSVTGLNCRVTLDLEWLQERYGAVTDSDKAILVNPNDIWNTYCENEKLDIKNSGDINRIYCHDSLAAPYLAAAKDGVIIFSPGNSLSEIKPWFQEAVNRLFGNYKNVKHLITIAGHNAIDTGSAEDGGHSLDRQIADFEGGPEEEIAFGRIMGITVSDTSSYIMRSIFYPSLYSRMYGSRKPGIIAIGHSFESMQDFLPGFISSVEKEYEAECYVQEKKYAGEVCKLGTKPPVGEYEHKNIMLFMGLGDVDKWEYTLDYEEIPRLDLSLGIAQASLTGSYAAAKKKQNLFSANFLRKGGIGYYGALSIAEVDQKNPPFGYLVARQLTREGQDLGSAMRHAIESMVSSTNKKVYVLFGDPSLNPNLPKTGGGGG